MLGACKSIHTRLIATIAAATLLVGAQPSTAQQVAWNMPPQSFLPMLGGESHGAATAAANDPSLMEASRGPLARLVTNPDRAGGQPPFALADQTGTIQRYVEPVPGIDLAPHVGQIVVVRHDTGQTLLASQLELPPQPLFPMIGADDVRPSRRDDRIVQQTQYADDDDATVELLDEGNDLPQGDSQIIQESMSPEMAYPPGAGPVFLDATPPGMAAPGFGPVYGDPMFYGQPMMGSPSPGYAAPCPECGGYHETPGFASNLGFLTPFNQNHRRPTHVYADVEINFLRTHVKEDALGKLSEKYEFSPRFILGFTGLGNLDGRVRYWLYGRDTPLLSSDGALGVEFQVFDVEATHRFGGPRSEVVLAAGPRFAQIELEDANDFEAGSDLFGITFAADGYTLLSSYYAGRFGWVYGGRLSILGGDWGGQNDLVDGRVRDDNVVVHELYAGVEYTCCYRELDLHARLAFEMQNWHSDVLADSVDTSIGIVGPGLQFGAEF